MTLSLFLTHWFKTQYELSGMRSINIKKLMGHSIGISDSYYRINDHEGNIETF